MGYTRRAMASTSVPDTLRVTTRNAWFQKAETVKRNRKKRWQHRLFFVEDVRSLNELSKSSRFRAHALIHCPDRPGSDWARHLLATLPADHHLAMSAELMAELSDKETAPSELQALVSIPDIDAVPPVSAALDSVVLLDRPSNPGNLGSILRSCDAFGIRQVVVFGHAVDPFDPVVVRAAAGAFFHVDVARIESREVLLSWLGSLREAGAGYQVVGTSAKTPELVTQVDFTRPSLVMFGNETVGLSDWLKSQCDRLVGLPMRGAASSLNLACAVTASLFELDRQRAAAKPALTSSAGSATEPGHGDDDHSDRAFVRG